MTVGELNLVVPVKDGRVKCAVLFPSVAAKLTSDTPLLGDFNVWSNWRDFLIALGVMLAGVFFLGAHPR